MAKKKTPIEAYNASLTPAQRKAAASRAGKASAEAKKARRSLAEELNALLSTGDTQQRLVFALLETALQGSPKAFETIRDTIGEKPIEQVELASDIVVNIE